MDDIYLNNIILNYFLVHFLSICYLMVFSQFLFKILNHFIYFINYVIFFL